MLIAATIFNFNFCSSQNNKHSLLAFVVIVVWIYGNGVATGALCGAVALSAQHSCTCWLRSLIKHSNAIKQRQSTAAVFRTLKNENNNKEFVNTANGAAQPPATTEDASLFNVNSLTIHARRHSRAGDKLLRCAVVATVVVSGALWVVRVGNAPENKIHNAYSSA